MVIFAILVLRMAWYRREGGSANNNVRQDGMAYINGSNKRCDVVNWLASVTARP